MMPQRVERGRTEPGAFLQGLNEFDRWRSTLRDREVTEDGHRVEVVDRVVDRTDNLRDCDLAEAPSLAAEFVESAATIGAPSIASMAAFSGGHTRDHDAVQQRRRGLAELG